MTYARKSLVSLADTPYYHVVARCVRRAWLWGFDEYAGKDYSHRKEWVLQRLSLLTSIFTIDVCAYAVMSNHYHLVVHIDRARAEHLTPSEVVQRWTQLFKAPPVVERWLAGKTSTAEAHLAETLIARWQRRLYDLSWFMKCLNEHLARRANMEDECDGRFWQGRFRSQALLDEAGLLTAMAYVDLNPIRAGIARTPEDSLFTSIHERIRAHRADANEQASKATQPTVPLQPFMSARESRPQIPFSLKDYLELVDWSGRVIREGKVGAIAERIPPIMQRVSIDRDAWALAMEPHGNVFGRALGRLGSMRLHAKTLSQSWVRGIRHADRLFAAAN